MRILFRGLNLVAVGFGSDYFFKINSFFFLRVRGEVYFWDEKGFRREIKLSGCCEGQQPAGEAGVRTGLAGPGLAGREQGSRPEAWSPGRPEAWSPGPSVGTGHVPAQLGPGGRARAGDRHPAALQGQGWGPGGGGEARGSLMGNWEGD